MEIRRCSGTSDVTIPSTSMIYSRTFQVSKISPGLPFGPIKPVCFQQLAIVDGFRFIHASQSHFIAIRMSTLQMSYSSLSVWSKVYSINRRLHFTLSAAVIPASSGCIRLVVFGGRNCTVVFCRSGMVSSLSCALQLSIKSSNLRSGVLPMYRSKHFS